MVETKFGFRYTKVSGTDFQIKKKHCGTDLSSKARRLALNDNVTKVEVTYDGLIQVRIRSEEMVTIGWGNEDELDHVPEDMHIDSLIMHEGEKASGLVEFAGDSA